MLEALEAVVGDDNDSRSFAERMERAIPLARRAIQNYGGTK
jgi:hypothetical protein